MRRLTVACLCGLVCWGSVGCVSAPVVVKGPTVLKIDPMYYGPAGNGYVGGLMKAEVRLEKSTDGRMHVGIFEQFANTTGEMWRASVWVAAFQAMMARYALGDAWRISVEVMGEGATRIDGPSAGGLITAAILAGQQQVEIDPTFTMTGTVNPDGSIGPVGGIAHKFEGAFRAGKRLLGFPLGQRIEAGVDLVKRFKGRPAKIVQIKDIYQAYRLMTGKALTRPEPLKASEMMPSGDVGKWLAKEARGWVTKGKRVATRWRKLRAVDGTGTRVDGKLLMSKRERNQYRAEQRAIDALINNWPSRIPTLVEGQIRRGEVAGAYIGAAQWHQHTRIQYARDQVRIYVERGEYERPLRVFNGMRSYAGRDLKKTMKAVQGFMPQTVSGLMTMIDACDALIEAKGDYDDAIRSYRKVGKRLQELLTAVEADRQGQKATDLNRVRAIVALVTPLLTRMASVQTSLSVARQNLKFGANTQCNSTIRASDVMRMEQFVTMASFALLHYFKATTVRGHVDFPDPRYKKAVRTAETTATLEEAAERSLTRTVLRMAGGFLRYMASAALSTIHYSLKATFKDGNIASLKRVKVLKTMLEMARRKALEHAAAAKRALGRVPVPSQVNYRIAEVYAKQRGPANGVYALESFWRSSMFSQLAATFGRRRQGY
jgi:hypothetical protein